MSSTADRRRSNSQGGGDFPRFDFKRIEIRKGEDGIVFASYDKDTKETTTFKGPISGVLLGSAYYQEAFHRGENNFYKSGVYFTKKNITMYFKGSKVFSGHQDDLEDFLKAQGAERAKKSSVIFVMTDEGNILGVYTNLVIGIDQMQNDDLEIYKNRIVLTTKEYDPADQTISDRAHEMLGSFAATNKPKYASVSEGSPITPEDEAKLGVNAVLDEFDAYKEFLLNGGAEDEPSEDSSEESQKTSDSTKDLNDDLPF